MKIVQRVQEQTTTSADLDGLSHIWQTIYALRDVHSRQELDNSTGHLPHFRQLANIEQAVSVLADVIMHGRKLVIVGDFDADGATSTALCMLALRAMGAEHVSYLIPNRFALGYGLSPALVDIAKTQEQAECLLTVDNGIACFAGAERARELGIQLVITDHHLPGETLPKAAAIVNPNLRTCVFPSKAIAGVGVAFYVLSALRATLQAQGWFATRSMPNLANYLDIVAIGTVADVVALDHTNRILVHQGLQRIRCGKTRPGIKALLELAGRDQLRLSATDIGFTLGPRLNAAGRLDDMSVGIECLLTDDETEARQLAQQLDQYNIQRRQVEQDMQVQAEAYLGQVDASAFAHSVVVYHADFHQGVIGILAGRLKERYYRPAVVFANNQDGTLKGSCRSIEGVHIRDVLAHIDVHYPHLLQQFGGHAMAAGLSLAEAQLDEFKLALDAALVELYPERPQEAAVMVDLALPRAQHTLAMAAEITQAGPWGQAFPEPVFVNVFTLLQQRVVGEKHLKVLLQLDDLLLDGIWFGIDLQQWPNQQARQVKVAYRLQENHFRGQTTLQCQVLAMELVD